MKSYSWTIVTCLAAGLASTGLRAAAAETELDTQLVWRRAAPSGACEIAAYSPVTEQLFVTVEAGIDVFELSSGRFVASIAKMPGHHATSVSCGGDVLAVAWAADDKTQPGTVGFYELPGREPLVEYEVGFLPDMVTFSPDGRHLLVANEGEPNEDYSFDPPGSVTILSKQQDWTHARLQTATFDGCEPEAGELCRQGTHLPRYRSVEPLARCTFAEDLEPEYITVSSDSRTAWVTLQENNALAEIDITGASVRRIYPLGYKDFSALGTYVSLASPASSGLDASDSDGARCIRFWPVRGIYQPDGIANFKDEGEVYLVTANEGDPRDYATFTEAVAVADLGKVGLKLDAQNPARNLTGEQQLGRLEVSRAAGDDDGDGDLDHLVCFGTRSFSLWRVAASGLELCYDSGSEFEQIIAHQHPELFNSDSLPEAVPDGRSSIRGPEPENLVVFSLNRHRYAAIALERTGGVMLYDITQPTQSHFVKYLPPAGAREARDRAPEGILFLGGDTNSWGESLLVVCNEGSGTISVYVLSYTHVN